MPLPAAPVAEVREMVRAPRHHGDRSATWRRLLSFPSLALLLVLFGARFACAHDPFEVTTQAQLRADSIELQVTMARSTALQVSGRASVTGEVFDPSQFPSLKPAFLESAHRLYEVRAGNTLVPAKEVGVQLGPENDVEFRLIYPRPEAAALRFDAVHIQRLPEGYGAVITVISDTGKMIGMKLLVAEEPSIEVPLGPPSAPGSGAKTAASASPAPDATPPPVVQPTLREFLKLGVEHI